MPTYELPGESRERLFPARIETIEFHGVEIMRIIGTQDEVQETTAMIDNLLPGDRRTFGDAQMHGYRVEEIEGRTIPLAVYELIVLRKVDQ